MKQIIRLTEGDLHRIVEKSVRRAINENLKTHDDEYNIYEKLDELDIPYDFINDWDNIIEIETENDDIRRKVLRLLNYYGWKCIKDYGFSICAERIYGDEWDNFDDKDIEKDSNYPHGVGIYYHITPYNKVNKILKQDWKYDGVVVSDWGGAHDLDQSIKNGLDMEFGTWTDGLSFGASNAYDNYYLAMPYKRAILEGKYSTKELDDKVRRVLRLFFRTTMNRNKPFGFMCSESHYQAARVIAEDGIVLLQNKGNVLPINLKTVKKVLVVGENAIKMMTVGGGSSSLKVQREVLPLEGLKKRLEGIAEVDYARGYVGDITGEYNGVKTGQDLDDKRSEEELIAEAVEKAKTADYVIVFGGLNKSDYQDAEGHDRKHFELPYAQDKLMNALAGANKNLVYVNISGNAVAMPWSKKVPAIVQGWFIGSEAGNALASILVGDANPSGKLPFSWMNSLNEYGAHALGTYPGTWRKDEKIIDEEYKEGIYVGYRWAESKKIKPLFAFGHGLSYTTFKLGKSALNAETATVGDEVTVTVPVTNTGNLDGKEVVQVYVSEVKPTVDRPVKELKGFAKVSLKAGETKDVKIVLKSDSFGFYDEAKGGWTTNKGRYQISVGNASDNITSKNFIELK